MRTAVRRVTALAVAVTAIIAAIEAKAGGTLTVGMTAGDLPATTGNPDQGFEGYIDADERSGGKPPSFMQTWMPSMPRSSYASVEQLLDPSLR